MPRIDASAASWIGSLSRIEALFSEVGIYWGAVHSAFSPVHQECLPAESLILSSCYGPGLDKAQGSTPTRPKFRYEAPEQPVSTPNSRPLSRFPIQEQLIPRRRTLRLQRQS
jgi:hypothetical protein